MNSGINLIAINSEDLKKKLKRLRFVRIIAVSFLVFVALASIVSFVLNSQIQIPAIKKDQDVVLQKITSEKEKAAKFYLIKDRISNISTLLTNRKNYIETIKPLVQNPPTGLSVDSFSIENNLLNISVSGTSLSSINDFIDLFAGIGNRDSKLLNLTIQSFVLDSSTSKYTLTVKSDLI